VKPLYLLLATFVLLSRLDALGVLATIPILEIFGQRLSVGDLLLVVCLPYFLVVLSELPVVLLGMTMQRLLEMTPGNRKAFELILRYALIGVGVLWLFNRIGLNGTAIATIAGGLSVGLGFGIKEVFSNFVSGLWLLFEGSVRPGEVLYIDGDPCEVRRLGLRAATLWRDRDNAELVIPNQTFFTSATTTYTGTDRLRRSQVTVGAGYQHEPEQVMRLLEEIALANPQVLKHPKPVALMLSYEDSSILYALRFWIDQPMINGRVCSEVNQAIWHAFRQHGIDIPFPQRVLHQAP
jgi:small-conductance mechanosensitive channel